MGKWGIALIIVFGVTNAEAAPVFGRFIGTLEHASIKKQQLAKLDFISSREENNTLFLKAILTLYMGDFASKEYVAYHFDDVRHNLLSQTFVFSQADQPVTFVVREFNAGRMVGEFRSAYSGEISKIVLIDDDGTKTVKPTLPIVDPVWGEYRGVCTDNSGEKMRTAVQLYTYRSNAATGEEGDPFRAYRIRGFIGEENGKCFEPAEICNWGNISKGFYNFYKGRLNAFNKFMNLECSVVEGGLECKKCGKLTRVSKELAGERKLAPLVSKDIFEKTEPGPALNEAEIESVQGEYSGYVHHEYLNRYHPAGLNLLTFQAPPEPGTAPTLRMSAIATLYFGEIGGIEALAYKFDERSYPNPLFVPQFVLSQADSDVDAILQITSLGRGIVKGVWYSRTFGRVGRFEFSKSGGPELPKDAKLMEALSGLYESSNRELNISVGPGTGAKGTENPFSPLAILGWTIFKDITPRIELTGGSFDFYTGRIGIEHGEYGGFSGDRPSRSRLYLKKLYVAPLAPTPPHDLVPFRLVEGKP